MFNVGEWSNKTVILVLVAFVAVLIAVRLLVGGGDPAPISHSAASMPTPVVAELVDGDEPVGRDNCE